MSMALPGARVLITVACPLVGERRAHLSARSLAGREFFYGGYRVLLEDIAFCRGQRIIRVDAVIHLGRDGEDRQRVGRAGLGARA